MNYDETLTYLYNATPTFHLIGGEAYKPGLERSIALDDYHGNPHKSYKTIHIAGTNGKGSVAHILASILFNMGYRVGLYTSPHLLSFTERIRVNGKPISENFVVNFVRISRSFIENNNPSFFELTSAMAFDYFRHKKVHYAIIETGMGGRLDSTNIIKPVLSIISSIGYDHKPYLGDTLLKIAHEKAGIIKNNVPFVLAETEEEEIKDFFYAKAIQQNSEMIYASAENTIKNATMQKDGSWDFESIDFGYLKCELKGNFQKKNIQTVLSSLRALVKYDTQIRHPSVKSGFSGVTKLTGFMGRWQVINEQPKIICDIGHNISAWEYINNLLAVESKKHRQTNMIIGFSKDKEVDEILSLLPQNINYYFTQANSPRALNAHSLELKAKEMGLKNGRAYDSVNSAVCDCMKKASGEDLIFIGGSAFIVGEALSFIKSEKK